MCYNSSSQLHCTRKLASLLSLTQHLLHGKACCAGTGLSAKAVTASNTSFAVASYM